MTDVAAPEDFSDVFVLFGALRSGTTLLRLILDGHPDIACPGERDFMLDHLQGDGPSLTLDTAGLTRGRSFGIWGGPAPAASDGAAALREMLAADRARCGKRAHVLVLHRHLARLCDLLPGIKIIHLLRDPRDVARSSIGMGWAGNTYYGIDHWLRTEREWDRVAVPSDRVETLKYEDLLEAPEPSLARLCAFMGLAYDPAMMNYAASSTYEPIDPALAYQWRRKQGAREIADVEYKAGPLLTARGYVPSGKPAAAPAPLRRCWLALENKRHIWRVRLRRYGLIDPVLVALGRKLRLPALGYAAQRRMDRKIVKYLR